MTERDKSLPIEDIDARLKRARQATERSAVGSSKRQDRHGLGLAMRLGVEIVSALVIGVSIGLLIDYWLDTKPWFMLLFFLFGSVAGFVNVYRVTAGVGQSIGYKRKDEDDASGDTR